MYSNKDALTLLHFCFCSYPFIAYADYTWGLKPIFPNKEKKQKICFSQDVGFDVKLSIPNMWIKNRAPAPPSGSELLFSILRLHEKRLLWTTKQSPQPTQNFWVFSLYIADFLTSESFGKMGQIGQIWGWKWAFLHLEGWKTTKYHIYTLIIQCSCH